MSGRGTAPVTLTLINAHIVTMDQKQARASSLSIDNGLIDVVGHSYSASHRGAVIDLDGATVLPGFVDTHVHAGVTGLGLMSCDLSDASSVDEVLSRVERRAACVGSRDLIVASGLDTGRVREGRFPTPEELDAASGGRPVYVMGAGGHDSAVNGGGAALIEAPRAISLIAGDLVGEANNLAFNQIWHHFAEQVGLVTALDAVMKKAVSGGITTVHTMDPLYVVEELLARDGEWPVTVVPFTETFDVEAVQSLGLAQIGGCGQVALDGDVGPRTAALLEPYLAHPTEKGTLYHDDDELRDFVMAAHAAGLQIALHCVGSGAIDQLLRAYEAVGAEGVRALRHRIEHFEVPAPGQAHRAAALGVCVSVQPAFNHFWPHHDAYPEQLGAERADRVDPVRSLVDAGVTVGFGSDSPVTPLSPLLGIHAAVNHSNVAERVDVTSALMGFTSEAARLSHHDGHMGILRSGVAADLVILGEDPFRVRQSELAEIPVLATIADGAVVFSDGSIF